MDLRSFSAENLLRCESPDGFKHRLGSWSLSDWMTLLARQLVRKT